MRWKAHHKVKWFVLQNNSYIGPLNQIVTAHVVPERYDNIELTSETSSHGRQFRKQSGKVDPGINHCAQLIEWSWRLKFRKLVPAGFAVPFNVFLRLRVGREVPGVVAVLSCQY